MKVDGIMIPGLVVVIILIIILYMFIFKKMK